MKNSDVIRQGTMVFVDANIFIYHFTGVSDECTAILRACECKEIKGVTSSHVLLEVSHRLMCLEALSKGLVSPGGVAKKLQSSPSIVQSLSVYSDSVKSIKHIGLEILSIGLPVIIEALRIQHDYGLLTNDSIILALMRSIGCSVLASADSSFECIPFVQTVVPADI